MMLFASFNHTMNDEKATISIIVPMYNVEEYIERFVKSIVQQTFKFWELLLVDDGSTDNTISIAKNLLENESRITLFVRDRDPKGANTCRNIGKVHAHGRYLVFFDADDFVSPICLQQRVKYMEEHPELDCATFPGESVAFDEKGHKVSIGRIWGVNTHKDELESFLEADYPYAVWNNIYRTESIANQWWDERLKIFQDFDFLITTLINKKSHAYAELSDKDYFYCVGNPNSISSRSVTDEKIESTIYLFSKTITRLKKTGNSKKCKKHFSRFALMQYEKIAALGSLEQLGKYTDFYCNNEFPKKMRIKILLFLVSKGMVKSLNVKKAYLRYVLQPLKRIKGLFKRMF